eukprot:777873_1
MSINTIDELTTSPPKDTKCVLLFWTSWHEDSSPNGSTSKLFETLATTTNDVSFYRIEAEENATLSEKYNVTIVPTFVYINEHNAIVDKVEGMDDSENIPKVTNALQNLIQSKSASSSSTSAVTEGTTAPNAETSEVEDPKEKLNNKLKSLINSSPIILFMKGTPTQPKCGFSRQSIELLSSKKSNQQIIFKTFNILNDDEVRQGLKTYSDWPTFPQLYVHGELVGGLDIMKEMYEEYDGDLVQAFELDVNSSTVKVTSADADDDTGAGTDTLEERLEKLIKRSKIMLFMKGLPSQPKCGFSRTICGLLSE